MQHAQGWRTYRAATSGEFWLNRLNCVLFYEQAIYWETTTTTTATLIALSRREEQLRTNYCTDARLSSASPTNPFMAPVWGDIYNAAFVPSCPQLTEPTINLHSPPVRRCCWHYLVELPAGRRQASVATSGPVSDTAMIITFLACRAAGSEHQKHGTRRAHGSFAGRMTAKIDVVSTLRSTWQCTHISNINMHTWIWTHLLTYIYISIYWLAHSFDTHIYM